MPAASSSRTMAAVLGLMAVTAPAALGQQSLGYQGHATSLGGGVGQPLNLLSPTFVAPPPRAAAPRPGPSVPAAAAMMTAPLPVPRPASAPQSVITQASAPAPVEASAAVPSQPVATQPSAQPMPQQQAEAPPGPPLLRPSMDDWPYEEDRSRVIIAGVSERPRPAPATGVEAIAEAAPQQARPQAEAALPPRAVSFAAPVPLVRPGATTIVAVSPAAQPGAGPVLASASSTPVSLGNQGTATTMVVPAPAAGNLAGAQQAVIAAPPPPRGPVLAALPPEGGARDWPRYVPGARGTDRNLGIAGERVMPDPGVPLTCLPAPVRRALNDVALRFGPVLVRSTHRGNGMFVRTDAWRGSYHRDCRAADFRVSGSPAAILAFLRTRHDLGGVKRYRNGLFHIDNGPRRSW